MAITAAQLHIQTALENAKAICKQKKVRFTSKRQHILHVLLTCQHAIGAYEIAELYSQRYAESIPTMSVYRILDFLTELGFVHKLNSINKFIACQHQGCQHPNSLAQFLICNDCQNTQEFTIGKQTEKDLLNVCSEMNFQLNTQQVELFGICKNCRSN